MVQKWCDIFVSCSTNITDVSICILHVLSHVNHNLKPFKESMATNVANVFSQVQIDLAMIGTVNIKAVFVKTVSATDQAYERKLMRVDVHFEILK